jgi:hypothetical protein
MYTILFGFNLMGEILFDSYRKKKLVKRILFMSKY